MKKVSLFVALFLISLVMCLAVFTAGCAQKDATGGRSTDNSVSDCTPVCYTISAPTRCWSAIVNGHQCQCIEGLNWCGDKTLNEIGSIVGGIAGA